MIPPPHHAQSAIATELAHLGRLGGRATVRDAVNWASCRLEAARVEEAHIDAEYLVEAAVALPRLSLALSCNRTLSHGSLSRLRQWVKMRSMRIPLAYILGEQPFYGRSYHVTPDVLIPRPETELLVERALNFLAHRPPHTIIDVGAGSGNIVISLAKDVPDAQLYAVDISDAALRIARMNAEKHGVEGRIRWLKGDLLEPAIRGHIVPGLVIANLPYIRSNEFARLQPEVLFEPRTALDGGDDGLALIQRCVAQSQSLLPKGGRLMMEIGADQEPALMALFSSGGEWTHVECAKDLSGFPRIIDAERKVPSWMS